MKMSVFKRFALSIQKAFLGVDHLGIKLTGNWSEFEENQPIFIIGAPRTGSTLLYQCLIERYKLCYISNVMSACPRFMITLAKVFPNRVFESGRIKKESYYGYVPGLKSPSEAGAIFRFWFESGVNKKSVFRTIESLSKICVSPFISKNLFNSLRIEKILETFPNARFIHIKRNNADVVSSILKGNKTLKNGVISLGLHGNQGITEIGEVEWEVARINEIIEEKKALVDSNRWLEIDYQAFCIEPELHIRNIGDKFDLETKENYETFSTFQAKGTKNVSV